MDRWASLAKDHTGLSFRIFAGKVGGGNFQYEPKLTHYVARDVTALEDGVLRIGVQSADGRFRALSNEKTCSSW